MGQKSIADFVDLEHLQYIQDCCSEATGVALVTTDYRGVPVTRYSGFTAHCLAGRGNPKFNLLCERCDAQGGIRSTLTGEPCVYRCHAGLVDIAVPIIVNGTYVGAVLGGQVRLEDSPKELESIVAPYDSRVDDPELAERLASAFSEVPFTSYRRLLATVRTLKELVTYAIGADMGPIVGGAALIQEKNEQLNAEREARRELEIELRRSGRRAARREEVLRHASFALDAIHCLAVEEGATRTDAASLDFADIFRYLIDTDSPIVTLGEELSYVEALLRTYKGWCGDSLSYEVRAPERYRSVSCPFMVLQPLVMAVIAPVISDPERSASIDIAVEQDGDWVVVQLLESGLPFLEVPDAFDQSELGGHFNLEFADQSLSRMTKGASSITAKAHPADPEGACISFRLPYVEA